MTPDWNGARWKIVQAGDLLIQSQQMLNQVRPDESSATRNQPGPRLGHERVFQFGVR